MSKIPDHLIEYFEGIIVDSAASANLLVLDPKGCLDLRREYKDPTGKVWRVYHYYENDLAFRREYEVRPSDLDFASIVWVTLPEGKKKIDLSFIPDVISRVDKMIDLGIEAVLSKLFPKETWPDNIFVFEKEIGRNLSDFSSHYKELRDGIRPPTPLNKNHIEAIILACRNPSLPINEIMFEETEPIAIIQHYLKIVWQHNLKEEDIRLLKTLVLESCKVDAKQILPWIREKDYEVAAFLYSYAILKRYEVSNPITLLKGLGMLGFDPEEMGSQLTKVIALLKEDNLLLENVIKIAEREVGERDMDTLINKLPFKENKEIANAILQEFSPLLVLRLVVYLLNRLISDKSLNRESFSWAKGLHLHPIFQGMAPMTNFTFAAQEMLSFLKEIAFIQEIVGTSFESKTEIASLLDWYEKTHAYRLELALAKSNRHLKVISDQNLKNSLAEWLETLKGEIFRFLENVDLNLADLIAKDMKGYFSHPRLSINVLRDFILKKGIRPLDKSRIWILIFDGMRLDTWNEVIKPMLFSKFEISEEKLYLCPLPSYTEIARISLLAGNLPLEWKDYQGDWTSDHNVLTSRQLGLPRQEGKQDLRIITASETDYAQRKLDFEVRPYNVLIYNLSDDWIHNYRDDVWELNQEIKGKLERNILFDLEARVGEDDYIFITSDHGFIELDRKNEIKIKSEAIEDQHLIVYRYLKDLEHPAGLKVQYAKKAFFTVACGRKWFSRERGRFNRYSHGGISLDEMVVPGVALKKLTQPIIKIEMKPPMEIIGILEDEPNKINIGIENVGNLEGEFNLTMQLDSGGEKSFRQKLKAKEKTVCPFDFIPRDSTKNLYLHLSYKNIEGREIKESKRLSIEVKPREDKVKIDTSALDKLDKF
ncbi:MAG: PglZ domain-containing protein [Candidatus Aerophobetes bacterium]|nr:PglZ domain-containing protein [Candidatus Aerophobetes bacterium]